MLNSDKWSLIINVVGLFFFLIAIPVLLIEHWDLIPSDRIFLSLTYSVVMIAFWPFHIIYHYVLSKDEESEFLQRIDRSSIFFLIAVIFSPGLHAYVNEFLASIIIVLLWLTVVGGTILVFISSISIRKLAPLLSSIMGVIGIVGIVLSIPFIPLSETITFCVGTGLLISSGIVYVLKKPDLKPSVFGFHEVFHILLLTSTIIFHSFVLSSLTH